MKFLALLLVLLSPFCFAAEESPEPQTTSDPAIEADLLKLKLTPLTADDLAVEASSWQDLLKAQTSEIVEAEIALREAEGEAKTAATETLDALKEEQSKLIERLGIVLDSWEAKGGDPGAVKAYVVGLRGADFDASNPEATVGVVRRWFKSEDGARKWVIKIAIFAVIVIVASILASLFGNLVGKAMARHKTSSQLLDRFVTKLVRRLIFAIGVIIAISTLGVKVGALLALIGGGAFILGFALQDTLSNFANGIMLMLFQPFDVGDAVEVAGVSGSVDSVSLVNTTIRSWDNKLIIVPNKSVWGQVITNITGNETRRVDMTFGIGYDDDIEKAQGILEKIVKEHELVLEDPAPVVKMHELADSSVNFVCRPWAKTGDYWSVYWDVTRKVKAEFDANDISIPYPQQDVHMHQVNGNGGGDEGSKGDKVA